MSDMGKLAVVAVAAALCAVAVRRTAPEIALVLALAAGAVMAAGCMEALSQTMEFVQRLAQSASLNTQLLEPVVKVAGIGLVSRMAAAICADARESGLAGAVETAGTVTALVAALPLMAAVLEQLERLL